MPTILKTKNSVTTTVVPTTLQQGELAVNITDKKLGVGNASSTPVQIVGAGTTGTAAGSNTQVQYNSSGTLAGDADFTFNGTTVTMANDASISGLTVGKGRNQVANNTAFGLNALASASLSGDQNVGIGNTALFANTTGGAGTAIGMYALALNTTGNYNTGLGHSALYNNTTASDNTAVGYQTGYSNTTGTFNTFVGSRGAGYSNTTASQNTFIGDYAGRATTTGGLNTFLGQGAARNNVTGIENIAIGIDALNGSSGSGSYNIAVGNQALTSRTTGANNVAMGWQSLFSNTTASNNTAVGYQAGYSATTGADNVHLGYRAGYSRTTGAGNTLVGDSAGYSLTTGHANTFVGSGQYATNGAGYYVTTGSNNTILGGYDGNQGGLDIRTASNYIVLSDGSGNPRVVVDNSGQAIFGGVSFNANSSVTISSLASNGCTAAAATTGSTNIWRFYNPNGQVGSISTNASLTVFSTTSDYRLKTVIGAVADAGQRIDALEPIEYEWKAGGKTRGFLAHKFAEIYPTSVNGEKDAVDKDGKPVYQGMQASTPEVMADLIAEIQSLRKRVALLESK